MPRTSTSPRSRRSRRTGTGARIGRPPRADAGNWEKFYVLLKLDSAAYIRAVSAETGHSLSSIIAECTNEGIALRLDREQRARDAETPEHVL